MVVVSSFAYINEYLEAFWCIFLLTKAMLKVYLFNLERKCADEQFGFNVVKLKNEISLEIDEVKKGSSAEKAGIKIGDVVIAVDAKNVSSAKEVYELCRDKLEAKLMIQRMVHYASNNASHQQSKQKKKSIDQRSTIGNANAPSTSASRSDRSQTEAQRTHSVSQTSQTRQDSSASTPGFFRQISRSVGSRPSVSDDVNNGSDNAIARTTTGEAQIRKKTNSANLRPLLMPDRQSLSNYNAAHRVESSTVAANQQPKTSLASILGEPECHVDFSHHKKDQADNNDDDDPTFSYRSILDICPEGNMLLSLAGRPAYSSDLRD